MPTLEPDEFNVDVSELTLEQKFRFYQMRSEVINGNRNDLIQQLLELIVLNFKQENATKKLFSNSLGLE